MNCELIWCPICRDFFLAPTQEIGSYFCPRCNKRHPKIEQIKPLDKAFKELSARIGDKKNGK
jgi:uncharacterized protein YbaR (Trm112 family)